VPATDREDVADPEAGNTGGEIMNSTTEVLEKRAEAGTAPASRVLQETPVEVNERGFMTDLTQWTPEVAWYLARRQGVEDWPREFTSDHWRVIDYMRTYYEATGNAPSLRYTCKALGLAKKRFSRLFPGGLVTARRISGLPGNRRSASRAELSTAQRLLSGNWWEHLTRPAPEEDADGRVAPVLAKARLPEHA
jgi:TusE/DsrC/DsvC family sulfur relay protein